MALKMDPISIIVYLIICIILYFCIAIIFKIIYLYLLLPPFSKFRIHTFDQDPLMIIPLLLWDIIYATPVMIFMNTVFVIIIIILLVLYILWIILKSIWLIGPIFLALPPFKQLEDAGIFQLIDDMKNAIITWLPKSIVKMLGRLFMLIIKFTKDKIIDIVKFINPGVKLESSKIDEILDSMNKSGIEKFENNVEKFENKDVPNLFRIDTNTAINQKNDADRYKNLEIITPDMQIYDRTYIIFNNEMKKINLQLYGISNNIKADLATTP